MGLKEPPQEEHGREVFDAIASSWYHLRRFSRFSPELEMLSRRWQRGRLINVGCAHGADFLPFKEHFELYGVDISPRMLEMARQFAAEQGLRPELIQADATDLPFPGHSFDWAIAVAIYHHLPSPQERLTALRELKRVLKPGGEAFITLWNHGQARFRDGPQNVWLPWREGGRKIYRFYHLFTYTEACELALASGFSVVAAQPEASFKGKLREESANICLLLANEGLE